MTDLFKQHEDEFTELSAEITTKIATQVKRSSGQEKRSAVRSVETDLEDAQEILDQMQLEVRSVPSNQRSKYQNVTESYKVDLDRLKQDLRKAEVSLSEQTRRELLDNEHMEMDEMVGDDQRQLLHRNTDTINRTTNRLRDAQRDALDIEEVGISILDNLNEQGDTLRRARGRLEETDSELRKSSRVAMQMYRHILQNKAIVGVVGVILVICIFMVIYFKFHK